MTVADLRRELAKLDGRRRVFLHIEDASNENHQAPLLAVNPHGESLWLRGGT